MTDDPKDMISPREVESKLISSYDETKKSMETVRHSLEEQQKLLDREMEQLRSSIGDHDHFLRTYFVRIVESISMFMGIFGIVVVIMVQSLRPYLDPAPGESPLTTGLYLILVILVPLLLAAIMLPSMWLVKRYILMPRH